MALKSNKKHQYHSGKMGAIVGTIIGILKAHPEFIDNIDLLRAHVYLAIPELSDKSKCPNCSASMKEYVFKFDRLDAVLLIAMGNEVKSRLSQNLLFTNANQVRVQDLDVSHAVKCRTTQCVKLGLVAELRNTKGQRVPGCWVITKRGFSALRGERVPKMVKVWRKNIEEKYDETTTISDALNFYQGNNKIGLSKSVDDYRDIASTYNPNSWIEFEYHEGRMI